MTSPLTPLPEERGIKEPRYVEGQSGVFNFKQLQIYSYKPDLLSIPSNNRLILGICLNRMNTEQIRR